MKGTKGDDCREPLRKRRTKAVIFSAVALYGAVGAVRANDLTWTGNTNASWNTLAPNWSTSGNATATWAASATNDIAHFQTSSRTSVTTGTKIQFHSISFEANPTTNIASSFSINFGSMTPGSGGNITLQSGAGAVSDSIGSSLTLGNSFSFDDEDSTSTSSLTFTGAITSNLGNMSGTTLTISGPGAGTNVVSGPMANGTFPLAILLNATNGAWKFSGSNSYSGGTVVSSNSASVTRTLILNGATNTNVLGPTMVTMGNSGAGGNGTLKIQGNVGIGSATGGALVLAGGDGASKGVGELDMRDSGANTLTLNNNKGSATDLTVGGANCASITYLDVTSGGSISGC